MRIDARISDVYAGQQARLQTGNLSAMSFSAAMDKAMADQSEKVDFSNMTRQEIRDWMSGQLHSEKMTFKESFPFLLLVGNGLDDTRHDFIQKARGCIKFALSHGDEKSVKRWEAALQIMQKAMSETE
jgi:hypothetical protein